MLQTKEQEKSLKTKLNEMKISYLPEREFKIVVIKILTKVRRAMHEQSENFNKEYNEVHKRKNGAEENNN